MTTIAVDGLSEEDFRRSIENRLREGNAALAVERLRGLLRRYAGPSRILPERFLTVTAEELSLNGWDSLGAAIARHERPESPVTALSIAFGWTGESVPEPDAEGRLAPHLETSYFTDDPFPFSQSGREDLLEGYSYHGCTWGDDCEATDSTLTLDGIDDLNGALAALEARLLASDEPDEEEILAGSLGACLLSVLLIQAVSRKIEQDGLPRPICVMAGSNGVYPYFDAPVVGIPEEARKAAEAAENDPAHAIPAPRYSSLLLTGIPRARKRAVLVLEESEKEMDARITKLRGLNHSADESEPALPEPEALPETFEPPLSDTAVAPSAASPLLVKKPGGHAWDFRDMLSPREPGPPVAEPALPDLPEAEPTELALPEQDWSEPDLPESDLSEPEPGDLAPTDLAQPEPAQPESAPPEPELPEPDLPEPNLPELDWSEPDWPQTIQPEPILPEPELPAPEFPAAASEPVAEPGFALLESNLQEQLDSLLAAHQPQTPVTPEPAAVIPATPAPSEYAGPFWPSGPGWFDEDEAPVQAEVQELPAVSPPITVGIPSSPSMSRPRPSRSIGSRPSLWARLRAWLAG